MSEKLYLPVSILISTLILSGTLFLVGGQISSQLQLSDLQTSQTGLDSTSGGETAQTAPAPTAPQTAPSQPSGALVDMAPLIEGAHLIGGNPDAPVQIVEFSDFECPYCGAAFPTVAALNTKYGDDIAIWYKHFPLNFHPNAKPAAIASECAAEQEKFLEYHNKLFENQKSLSTANLKQFAVDLGLNAVQFNDCFDSSKYSSVVDADFQQGTQSGVSGTPSFFIGKKGGSGQKFVGAQPKSNFVSVIDPLLG